MSLARASFLLALLFLTAGVAEADGGAPEGARLSQLDSQLSAAKRARITTSNGVAVISDMHATTSGIAYHNLLISQGSDSLGNSGVIEWQQIRGIETTDGTPSPWLKPIPLALAGAGLGLVAFYAVGGTTNSWTVDQPRGPFLVVGAAAGLVGGRFARRFGSHWRRIYP